MYCPLSSHSYLFFVWFLRQFFSLLSWKTIHELMSVIESHGTGTWVHHLILYLSLRLVPPLLGTGCIASRSLPDNASCYFTSVWNVILMTLHAPFHKGILGQGLSQVYVKVWEIRQSNAAKALGEGRRTILIFLHTCINPTVEDHD